MKKKDPKTKAVDAVMKTFHAAGEVAAIKAAFAMIFENMEEFPILHMLRHLDPPVISELSQFPILAEVATNLSRAEVVWGEPLPEVAEAADRLRCIAGKLSRAFAVERLLMRYWVIVPNERPFEQIMIDQFLARGHIVHTEYQHAVLHLLPDTQKTRIMGVTPKGKSDKGMTEREREAVRLGTDTVALLSQRPG